MRKINRTMSPLQKMRSLRNHNEEGYTLIEIMVAIVLFAVIGTVITTSIVSLGETTEKFTLSTLAQDDVVDASLIINRDISSSARILSGTDYSIGLRSTTDNVNYDVNIFYWNSADSTVAPTGVDTSTLPNKSIVESRKVTGGSEITTQVLVTGYEKSKQATSLFSFYNQNNAIITAPLTTTTANSVQRVGYTFSVDVNGRAKPITMTSSASPRLLF